MEARDAAPLFGDNVVARALVGLLPLLQATTEVDVLRVVVLELRGQVPFIPNGSVGGLVIEGVSRLSEEHLVDAVEEVVRASRHQEDARVVRVRNGAAIFNLDVQNRILDFDGRILLTQDVVL